MGTTNESRLKGSPLAWKLWSACSYALRLRTSTSCRSPYPVADSSPNHPGHEHDPNHDHPVDREIQGGRKTDDPPRPRILLPVSRRETVPGDTVPSPER